MTTLKDLNDKDRKDLAISSFNEIWNYIDKIEDLEVWEKDMMIALAHTSRYFWGLVGTPLHYQRGEWMLSHVYTLVGRSQSALHHAEQCWELTVKEDIKDFDLAFAHEALARAYALNKKASEAKSEYEAAKEAAEKIAKTEDKTYFLEELAKGPWFGMSF